MVVEFEGKKIEFEEVVDVFDVHGPYCKEVEVQGDDEDGDHDHDEDHGMAIHVVGVSSGSTSFQLQLMHEGHADYTSTNNVPVTVN